MECNINEDTKESSCKCQDGGDKRDSKDLEVNVPVLPEADVVVNSNEDIFNEAGSSGDKKTVKIVVFGKDGAGKTALIVRLLTRRFIHEYDPTSENVYAHHSVVNGEEVVLKIMDTAGMVERNMHEREEQIRWGDGFLMVLSLINEESIKVLHLIRALIEKANAESKPIALVANKRDLLHAREVSSVAVSELAVKWNCRVFETSATEDYSVVEEPFIFLCSEVMNKKKSGAETQSKTKIDNELILSDVHKNFQLMPVKNSCQPELQLEKSMEFSESL